MNSLYFKCGFLHGKLIIFAVSVENPKKIEKMKRKNQTQYECQILRHNKCISLKQESDCCCSNLRHPKNVTYEYCDCNNSYQMLKITIHFYYDFDEHTLNLIHFHKETKF